jgi:alkanesulfonate monooxygenase SsuD/methylene tetrahydromethanopterin reductase-like flavin-dependent oxidoreductase (luciferase family)
MTQLAGEVADGIVTHPTNASPRYLRERTAPNLEAGAQRARRSLADIGILAGGFVATGPSAASVGAERERIREYLTFLYSTPQYWPSLELHGWLGVGRKLHRLARDGRWTEMRHLVTDEMLDRLVPAGTYDEIAEILDEWYGGLATGITVPMPEDPADDPRVAAVVAALQDAKP